MTIRVTHNGSFKHTESWLNQLSRHNIRSTLSHYGKRGVEMLSESTPVDTGETANSWRYEIKQTRKGYSLSWHNDVLAGKTPLVILLSNGHATRDGRYIPGNDFIDITINHILDDLTDALAKELSYDR